MESNVLPTLLTCYQLTRTTNLTKRNVYQICSVRLKCQCVFFIVMANSRSDTAPENFLISSSNDISHFTNPLKCQLCMLPKQSFHCAACITTGNFINSNNPHERWVNFAAPFLLRITNNDFDNFINCVCTSSPVFKLGSLRNNWTIWTLNRHTKHWTPDAANCCTIE